MVIIENIIGLILARQKKILELSYFVSLKEILVLKL